MTCIVGLVHKGAVWMGADSVGVDGHLGACQRLDTKLFRNGEFLIGFTTSFRMGQLLRCKFKPPAIETWDLWRYMATDFVDAARGTMRDGGFLRKGEDGDDVGGGFLVGVRGQLFEIESDFQAGVPADGYASCGCGAAIALGALAVTTGDEPRARLQTALMAAERHSAGVRAPFIIDSMGGNGS